MPLVVILLVLCGASVSACGGETGTKIQSTADTVPIVEIPARWASANANDVATLNSSSDAVFVGRVLKVAGQRFEQAVPDVGPSGLEPGVRTHAATRPAFPITVFELEVVEVLAGDLVGGQHISIEQLGGLTEAGNEQVYLVLEGDAPVNVGATYLFFVKQKANGSYNTPPFGRFQLESDGLSVVGPWRDTGAARVLSGLSADEAKHEIVGSR